MSLEETLIELELAFKEKLNAKRNLGIAERGEQQAKLRALSGLFPVRWAGFEIIEKSLSTQDVLKLLKEHIDNPKAYAFPERGRHE